MQYTPLDRFYINMGTNNPLNMILNVFGKIYIHVLPAG